MYSFFICEKISTYKSKKSLSQWDNVFKIPEKILMTGSINKKQAFLQLLT